MKKLSCGIVGLPNVGKSTLFNALTGHSAGASNFPFCTIDPNVGIVPVPDPRLEKLAQISSSKKVIPAGVHFVDIAGLVKRASQGEGLGNKFLANIRETDAILHLVRCFDDENVIHVDGVVNPLADVETIETELCLADLQMTQNITQKLNKQLRGDPSLKIAVATLEKLQGHLDEGLPARTLELAEEEKESISSYPFITAKRIIYAANVSEEDLADPNQSPYYIALKAHAEKVNAPIIVFCADLEAQIAQLEEDERDLMLKEMGIETSGLERLIQLTFKTLGLITFLTTGEIETRAWTIREGTLAPKAAGEIHSDIENGFIRAEVVNYEDFIECEGRVKAKELGKARFEGKEYVVQDGDVILFFHN